MMDARDAVLRAKKHGTVIPAYNIPYLPMMQPVIQAVVDKNSIAMIQVARIEWEKFDSKSLEEVAKAYQLYKNTDHTLLHLDHIPVIDEDMKEVDYLPIIERAIKAGYQSVMIDASRLDLAGNIEATKQVAEAAHAAGIPCEAELGAVMGHEDGPRVPYEEIFSSKKGFTDVEEAKQFAQESGCDWLSIAAGSIHGAVAENLRHQKKPEARLDIEHIKKIAEVTNLPLVLHGGSGINKEFVRQGIQAGIAKINVGTEIRQAYEDVLAKDEKNMEGAKQAVYEKVCEIITEMLLIENTKTLLYGE